MPANNKRNETKFFQQSRKGVKRDVSERYATCKKYRKYATWVPDGVAYRI